MNLWTIIKGLLIQDETDRTKELSLEINPSATTNTKTIVQASQTANRTLNLPDISDTLISKNTTDTLTNKTMDFSTSGTNSIVADATDILFDNAVSGLTAIQTQDALDELDANLDAHMADISDAHDASAISNIPAGSILSTDVQAAINELDGDINTVATNLSNHITDLIDAHDASSISNIPAGTITSIDVQAAINELDTDISNHINDISAAHAASAISNTPLGNLASTDVQSALNELQGDIDSFGVKANPTLDNLTNTIAIPNGVHLLPANDLQVNLGSATNRYQDGYIDILRDSAGLRSINNEFRFLFDTSDNTSIAWSNRQAFDSSSVISLDYGIRALYDSNLNQSLKWDDSGNVTISHKSTFSQARLLNFKSGDGLSQVGIRASHSAISSYNLVLPTAQGAANTSLRNDGSGNLSWGSDVDLVSVNTNTIMVNLKTYLVDSSGGPITMSLPAASSNAKIVIKDKLGTANTNNITIDSGTIDGSISYTLASNYGAVTLVSDGTNWYAI